MKNVIKLNLMLLISVLSATSCIVINSKESKQPYYLETVVEQISLGEFEEIEMYASVDLICEQRLGETAYLRKSKEIDYEVNNGKLILRNKEGDMSQAKIYVSLPQLSKITINGSGNASVKNLKGDMFSATVNGSGSLTLMGNVVRDMLMVNGSGSINGYELIANTSDCFLNGSGNIAAYAANILNATANGSGLIKYRGNPKLINKMGNRAYNVK